MMILVTVGVHISPSGLAHAFANTRIGCPILFCVSLVCQVAFLQLCLDHAEVAFPGLGGPERSRMYQAGCLVQQHLLGTSPKAPEPYDCHRSPRLPTQLLMVQMTQCPLLPSDLAMTTDRLRPLVGRQDAVTILPAKRGSYVGTWLVELLLHLNQREA